MIFKKKIYLDRIPPSSTVIAVRFSSLGDLVLLGGVLKTLHRARPDLSLILVTLNEYEGLFSFWKWLRIISLSKKEGFQGLLKIRTLLSSLDPYLLIDFHHHLRSVLLRLLFPAPWVVVPRYDFRRYLMVYGKIFLPVPHLMERYRSVFSSLPPTRSPWVEGSELPPPPTGTPEENFIVLAPFARWRTKEWGVDRFHRLADFFREKGIRIVWVGEEKNYPSLKSAVKEGDGVFLSLPYPSLYSLLSRAVGVVSPDSAIAHMASAVGVKVVVLFGPTVPAFGFTPYGDHRVVEVPLPCRPCSFHGGDSCPLKHHLCMTSISEEKVTETALRYFFPG